jgi:DNA-binding CsgD family transcriptional regulator
VVGTALSVGGDSAEAGQLLARAVELAGDDELADAALAYARHLLWIERRFGDSMTVLEEALERVPARDRPRLRVEQATQLAPQGALERALGLVDGVVQDPSSDEPTLLGALTWSTLIRVMLGRFDDLEPDLARAEQLAEKHGDDIPLAQDQVGANRVMMALCQDVNEARTLTVEGQARCEERGGGILIWTVCRSWAEMSAGEIDAALRTTRRALDEAEAFDPFGNRAMTWCTRALALALAGRAGEARRILESLDEDSMEPRTRVWFDRARLRTLAAESSGRIVDSDRRGVDRAREAGLHVWAADLAFDLVRCGGRGSEALEELAAEVSADSMVPIYARAAEAVEQGEESAILRVAEELVHRGARLPAAELVANVARHLDGAAGARLATLCLALLRGCPGAGPLPIGEVPDPLTDRESQVARMAARGSTSREIADTLYLSVRTVDNHLARVYRKLGLSGREELVPWFPMEAPERRRVRSRPE